MRIAGLLLLMLVCVMPLDAAADQSATPACPVTLGTLQLSGITSDQTQWRYRTSVVSNAKGLLALDFAYVGGNSQVISRSTSAPFDPSSGSVTFFIWSPKPLTAVRIERVVPTGSVASACSSEASLADADHADPGITVFSRDFDLGGGATSLLLVRQDARMTGHVQPLYPEFAAQQGLSADVVVKVTIGPRGMLQNASVYRTSDVPAFDAAALAAARRNSYSEPRENGKAVTDDYVIDYVFRMEGQPRTDPCGATIASLFLRRAFDQTHSALFDVSVGSDDQNITSVNLGFYNSQSRTGVTVALPQIVFEKSDTTTTGLTRVEGMSRNAGVLWVGPPINYVDLQSVTGLDGSSRPCHWPAVRALDTDDHAVAVAGASDTDMAAAHAYLVLPARYEERAFPLYPAPAVAAGNGGCANVLAHVNASGSPDVVQLVRGSGYDALDGAAIQAATASRYRLTSRAGSVQTEYYSATYCFSTPRSTP
jgi:TonB family protein